MRRSVERTLPWVIGIATAVWMTAGGVAHAEAPWVRQAKGLGLPARNCLYCHTTALPKKENFRPEELNERGRWLLRQKRERGTKAVELELLKQYPGGPEQK